MEPNLSCRMYEPLYPEVNRLVMGEVTNMVNNDAVVSLLEFEGLEATISNSGERGLVVGRAMPFRVLDVNENGIVRLSPLPLTLDDKWDCDREYVKARHVHRVLFSVAEDTQMNLEALYTLAGWPTYHQLLSLHENQAFIDSDADPDLKEFLLERIKLMVYSSWRIDNPRVLQFCTLEQVFNTSYAIALVRQAEAYLKLTGRLPFPAYLSIQDLINKANNLALLDPDDGSVQELEPVSMILVNPGLVLDSDCPLQNNFAGEYTRDDGPVHRIDRVRVYVVETNVPAEMASADIIDRLEVAPMTCSLVMYPSYQNNLQEDTIYGPTEAEVLMFGVQDLDSHSMLCTGHGVDRWGEKFLEFQDSRGDIQAVDHGFVRFAQDNTIADYVYFLDHA